ncbi:peptide-N4-(N-acetyl-beta-glucosaminyl)asparagine amidase A [Gastrolobium bilobum]|uniref:peptide-N4-(N-acetyl-beta- glucosaminyl)asparagine amidase A n=1 Tax=Gastrolobium bilobum TaxID=150636 RepID=UPI002AAF463A|nr:peptide-N4-(N-acetyl-beta-glucosaminyl)asparagine amidase A [Gastrolobium bilobum]
MNYKNKNRIQDGHLPLPTKCRYKMDTFQCLLFLLLVPSVCLSQSHPDRFIRSRSRSHRKEYFEVSYPPPSHEATPSCSHQIIHHSFANTIDSPPYSTPYSPPSHCPAPWSRVVLRFHAKCKGEQYDRIAAIWLGGVELFRTSTAEPTNSGIFWNVRKDVTRYSSLLARSDLELTMMLENIVNHEYTGVYHVTVTLLYYNEYAVRFPFSPCPQVSELNRRSRSLMREESEVKGFWDSNESESPADLIIPISDDGKRGFWFKVEDEKDLKSRRIQIPQNTHRAVLELYVSFHGNDEFWYSNPPSSYITANGLTTGRGNGAYREVYVTIDGEVVGWEVPFPVIFTGGINPLFWEPMVAIGAFNLPSYDMDLTPFLGKLLDGQEHAFGIGVARGISYWLVNANLHLWLDHESSEVHANRVVHMSPETSIEHQEEFKGLDGVFEVEAGKETQIAGWVLSSAGNITTSISQGFTLKNFIKFQHNGTYKMVKQKFKAKKKVKVINGRGELISKLKVKRKYPLRVITSTEPCCQNGNGNGNDRYRLVTNVSHAFKEKYVGGCFINSISNVQDSKGWMEVKGHSVLSGQATTKQNYSYTDRFNCYSRNVASANGRIIADNSTFNCENSL